MSDQQAFLDTLFGFKNENHRLLVWTRQGHEKRSCWFASAEEVAAHEWPRDADVYVGLGLSSTDRGPHARCPEAELVALAGFWLDVDYEGEGHKRPGLPPQEVALQIIDSSPATPSAVVHSGHGYQAFWAFKEPWLLETMDERAEAKRVLHAWQTSFARRLREQGYAMDMTADLARVMRLPGTWNCKGATPVLVTLVSTSDWRAADLDDFRALLRDEDFQSNVTVGPNKAPPVQITLNADAQPPAMKFSVAVTNDIKFRRTFERKRGADLGDQSASGYDMSLAVFAVRMNWSDQEICDLMILSRKTHGDDLKLDRVDYYARTIAAAHAAVAKDAILGELPIMDASDPDVLPKISEILGVRLEGVTRYETPEGGQYYIYAAGGKRQCVGDISGLWEQKSVRGALGDLGLWTNPLPRAAWLNVCRLLRQGAADESLGPENTERGQMQEWLASYLESHKPVVLGPEQDRRLEEVIIQRYPFAEGGMTYIVLDSFVAWLRGALRINKSSRTISAQLRFVGWQSTVRNVTVGGLTTTRALWSRNDLVGKSEEVAMSAPQNGKLPW